MGACDGDQCRIPDSRLHVTQCQPQGLEHGPRLRLLDQLHDPLRLVVHVGYDQSIESESSRLEQLARRCRRHGGVKHHRHRREPPLHLTQPVERGHDVTIGERVDDGDRNGVLAAAAQQLRPVGAAQDGIAVAHRTPDPIQPQRAGDEGCHDAHGGLRAFSRFTLKTLESDPVSRRGRRIAPCDGGEPSRDVGLLHSVVLGLDTPFRRSDDAGVRHLEARGESHALRV